MAATLTERYISATIKTLPPTTQEDVRIELAASIADAVDARTAQGESPAEAERAVLTDLGDPAVLAARYADRPLQLIGPRYYLTWWQLLKLLWIIVPATAMAGVVIANTIADKSIGEIIGATIAVGVGAIVHVAFWTTLVFFILERTGTDTGMRWTPDALPEPQESGASRSDLIASLIFLGVGAAALLWDRFIGFVRVAEGSIDVTVGLGSQTTAMSILNQGLWPWWLGAALVLIGGEAALAIAVYAGRGWRPSLAVMNTVLAVVFAVGSIYLLVTGQLLNPEFVEFTLGRADDPSDLRRILAVLLTIAIAIVAVAGWDIVDSWIKTRRAQRAA